MGVITVEKCPVCGHTHLEPFIQVVDYSISGEAFNLVRCPECELCITQAHPDQESIGKYYASEDYISHSDTSQGVINRLYHAVRSYMLDKKQSLVEKHGRKGKLLDIGAGTGYFAAHMQDAGWDVLSLEPDPGARAIGEKRFNLQMQDIDTLHNLPDASFEVITMWHVLEHVHNLNADLAKISKLLRPDGLLVIAVPNPTSVDARKYGEKWAAYDVPRHLWHFAPKSMKTLLDKHGLDVTSVKSMPFDAFYVSMLSEKYRGSSIGPVLGGVAGLKTYTASLGNVENASSLIYLARPKTS